jgi:hypothetical protein
VRLLQAVGLVGILVGWASACDNEVETAGLLTFGFETSSFVPCGHQDAWWVVGSDELVQRYAALQIPPGQSAYARLRGDRSDRGQYGHLGTYRAAPPDPRMQPTGRTGAQCLPGGTLRERVQERRIVRAPA